MEVSEASHNIVSITMNPMETAVKGMKYLWCGIS